MSKSRRDTIRTGDRRTAHAARRKRNPPASASTAPPALQVLLVDDHVPVLRFLAVAFSANGCEVATAASAEDALDLLSDRSFDLVVSDIKMPGMSGLDLLREVKGKDPRTPVVLVTGMPSVDSAVFGLRHQAFDYLTKPFTLADVRKVIQRVRQERVSANRSVQAPAGLTKELVRRQFGLEALSRIGELATQGLDPAEFMDRVLGYTLESLGGDAVLIVLRDDEGNFTPSQKGDPALATRLLSLSQSSFQAVQRTKGKEAVPLTGPEEPFAALAALIPGVGRPLGILSLARSQGGGFLPDEKEFLLGYARTIALALEKVVLGGNLEGHLVDTISSFVIALESKDPDLKGHSARVSLYAGEIAKVMGLPPSQVAVARRAALLHDLGKLVVMDSILQKPARLTSEELELMREHPENAAKILKPFRFLAQEAEAVRAHHERHDGRGYPEGLKGDQIPLAARIVSVADALDAMTSDRPYHAAVPVYVAVKHILRHAGAQFDPSVTDAFARIPLERLIQISRLHDDQQTRPQDEESSIFAAAGPWFSRREALPIPV